MDAALELRIHGLMVQARVLEDQLIAMVHGGDGYFWIGGPGEEAFNVPLGLLVQKGEGPSFDYLHFSYRSSATLLAMGAAPIDTLRQMRATATDPYTGGRNFANHYARREWNVLPVTSAVAVQYSQSIGTAHVQKREGGTGITIVNGGDAGAAEGDFATCLVWSSRPGAELPILILVMNNHWGISTESRTQWPMTDISSRAGAFGIRHARIDGNDVAASWAAIESAMDYVRHERRPFCLQADVSRLHGHSSSTGGALVDERDCLKEFEAKLITEGKLSREDAAAIWEKHRAALRADLEIVRGEPLPDPATIHDYTFWGRKEQGT